MSAPRFHSLARLLIFALGVAGAMVLLSGLTYGGSLLASVWTGRSAGAQLAQVFERYPLLLNLLLYPPILAWLAYCRLALDKRSFASLGLHRPYFRPEIVRGMLAGALAMAALFGLLWLCGALQVQFPSSELQEAGWSSAAVLLLGYALFFLAVAFMEEVVFRGYALHNLFGWLGWLGATVGQASLFAIVHLGNTDLKSSLPAIPSLVLVSLFFALAYRKTGSLWFPIGFHWAWNFFLGCIFSLPVSGINLFRLFEVQVTGGSWLTGGAFGPEASLLLLPILGAMLYFLSIMPDHPQALTDLQSLRVAAPEVQPAPEPEIEAIEVAEVEEPRENRYKSRFGRTETFDAETLRQLRDLQEKREREGEEAARHERELAENAEKVADFAPGISGSAVETLSERLRPAPEPISTPVETSVEPVTTPEPTPTTPSHLEPAPTPESVPLPAETPPVKKSAPRW